MDYQLVVETLKTRVEELESINMKQFEQNKHLSCALERAQAEIKQLTLNPNIPQYRPDDTYQTTLNLIRDNKLTSSSRNDLLTQNQNFRKTLKQLSNSYIDPKETPYSLPKTPTLHATINQSPYA